ncbi:mucin-binding protein [Loigolactobacillus iwatensis]|uniref:mucin-binding protein n=1 Tax=Loigolactobacillus iwatensis TaxID=1267156 RepID=UPI000F7F31D8|nr:KxYKxGKxW signal peptide domain-containing protein [Loigolactobacillus iwatensis]
MVSRYRMYKAGKFWVFAGITTAGLLSGMILGGTKADAATVQASSTAAQEVTAGSAATSGNTLILANSTATNSVSNTSAETSSAVTSTSSAAASPSTAGTGSSAAATSSESSAAKSDSNTIASINSASDSSSATASNSGTATKSAASTASGAVATSTATSDSSTAASQAGTGVVDSNPTKQETSAGSATPDSTASNSTTYDGATTGSTTTDATSLAGSTNSATNSAPKAVTGQTSAINAKSTAVSAAMAARILAPQLLAAAVKQATDVDLKLLSNKSTTTDFPATYTAPNYNSYVFLGVSGTFDIDSTDLAKGDTVLIQTLTHDLDNTLSGFKADGPKPAVTLKDGTEIGYLTYDATAGGIVLKVDNDVTSIGTQAFTISAPWLAYYQQTSASYATGSTDTLHFGDTNYTVIYNKINLTDAQKLTGNYLSVATSATGASLLANNFQISIATDTDFTTLQNSEGQTGTVASGPVEFAQKINNSSAYTMGSRVGYSLSYGTVGQDGKLQGTPANTVLASMVKGGYVYITNTNYGAGLTLDQMRARAEATPDVSTAGYSLQADGSYLTFTYIAAADLKLDQAAFSALMTASSPLAETDSGLQDALDYHYGVLDGRALGVTISNSINFADSTIANDATEETINPVTGAPLLNATGTSTPNTVSVTGKSSVIVHYVDEQGNDLTVPVTTTGAPGIANTAEVQPFAGYEVTQVATIPGANVVSGSINGGTTNYEDVFPADGTEMNIYYVYKALPQAATITYIDDTTKETLDDVDTVDGVTGAAIDYSTADRITDYETAGYVLVSDGFLTGATFDTDTATDQAFVVHLKHDTTSKDETAQVTQTVHYQYADGTPAFDDVTDAVNFSCVATTDKVTGEVSYSDWIAANGDTSFAAKSSPELVGYTPSQSEIATVTGITATDKDYESTVIYTADLQKASVTYIDDTTGDILATVPLQGDSGSTSDYQTTAAKDTYVAQNYKVVSDDFPAAGLTFDTDKDTDQAYVVHLAHTFTTADENQTVNRVIHYVYADQTTAKPDATTSVTFTRTVTTDEVTGLPTATTDWVVTTGSAAFAAVASPTIAGYTPDKATVAGQTVTVDSDDIEDTVTYKVDLQKASVTYIDDTTGDILATVPLQGDSGSTSDYQTAATKATYVAQNYQVVSDDFPVTGLTFDTDKDTDQTFEVHLAHTFTTADEKQTASRVIHYVYANGNTAAPDATANADFTRVVTTDKVTGRQTYTDWGTAAFTAVVSPAITGYTPDKATVAGQTVTADSGKNEITVTYNGAAQRATVKYVDDTTGQQLGAVDTIDGVTGAAIDYSTATRIGDYEAAGYVLVGDGFSAGATFDTDTATDQAFEVHLKHGTATTSETDPVKRVIHYVYENGDKAANDVTDNVTFTRNVTTDKVTNVKTPTAWIVSTGNANFTTKISPIIAGYTPNETEIAGQTVTAGTADIEDTVTYKIDAQKASVTYVDDTTGQTLATKTLTGDSGSTSNYQTAATKAAYVAQNYQVVSDDFPVAGLTFDTDKDTDQTFEVHLAHTFTTADEKQTASRVIHYVYANGNTAAPDATANADFTRTVTTDKVTGRQTYTDWGTAAFTAVVSPVITGYTPDQATVAGQTVTADSGKNEITVTYNGDLQHATVSYIDDTTGKTLKQDFLTGQSDQSADYSTAATKTAYITAGYAVVSDNYPGTAFVFDEVTGTTQNYAVHLTHATTSKDESAQVTQTVHYQYANGKQAFADVNDAVNFSCTATTDKVTGEVSYSVWTATNGDTSFTAKLSPKLAGYTSNPGEIAAVTGLTATDANRETTVIYTADQQKATITYVDDTTGKTLKVDGIEGATGTAMNYQTATQINQYTAMGYKFVSDNFPAAGMFDADTAADQAYTVHLAHTFSEVSENKTVNRTIHYQFADGTAAAADVTDGVTFTRNGTKDAVTGGTTFSNWTTKNNAFATKISPTITGYTPDLSEVAGQTVTAASADVEVTVKYTADQQKAVVSYIDDTTGKVLTVETLTGNSGSTSDYQTTATKAAYVAQGYAVSSDNFPATGLIFDQDKNVDQHYEVHLVHGTTATDENKTVKQTIHYVYTDGKTAAPDSIDTVAFTRTATTDKVTGVTVDTAWTANNGDDRFDAKVSPTITGYVPDQAEVAAVTGLNAGDTDQTVVVTYTATQPGTPGTPTEPTEPGTPTTPTEPGTPATPTEPTEPGTPTTPTQPAEPSTSETPTQPTESETAVTPETPVTSAKTTETVASVTPAAATTSNVKAQNTQKVKLTADKTVGAARLPQTGAANESFLTSIGILMLTALSSLMFWRKRKE